MSNDEDGIDNLMNDSGYEFIAEEEITQAASTQDLTTTEANLYVVQGDNQSKRREKTKKKNYGREPIK